MRLQRIVVVLVSLSKLDRNLQKLKLRNPVVSMNVSARLSNKSCSKLNEHLEDNSLQKTKLGVLFQAFFSQIVRAKVNVQKNNYSDD